MSLTQRFKTVKSEKGFCFVFYCDLCDHFIETPEVASCSYAKALGEGETYARRHFNKCHECGKWICDEHYNEDEMKCIQCAPHTNRIKPYITVTTETVCRVCGYKNDNGDCFCQSCGKAL